MKLYDQHLHSSYSEDSKASLEKYFAICKEKNIPYIVTTEHLDFNNLLGEDWIADFSSLEEEMKKLSITYQVKSLLGIEAGFRYDQLDKTRKVIASHDFDVVGLSIHDDGIRDFYWTSYFEKEGIDVVLEAYFNYIILGLKTIDDFDVLSHVDYGFKTAYKLDKTLRIENYESFLKEIFNLLIKKDKALEINLKVQETIQREEHLRYILRLYKSLGGSKLTVSSDSHAEKEFIRFEERSKPIINIIKDEGYNKLCYFIKRKTYYLDI